MAQTFQTQRLLDAIRCGDRQELADAIGNGADINANDGEPLWLAASHQRHDIAVDLLKLNANIHLATRYAAMKKSEASNAYGKAMEYAAELQRYDYHYSSPASYSYHYATEKAEYDRMSQIEIRLSDYHKGYLDTVAAQKADKIDLLVREIREMREMFDKAIIKPEPLEKALPDNFRRK